MKTKHLALLLPLVFVLSACGKTDARTAFEAFSSNLNEQDALAFTARVRAEYDDRRAEFTLNYAADEESTRITVVSPEIIRGVSARIRAGETALEYEGVSLDTGALDNFGLSPMSALPLLIETLKTGYLDTAWEEDGTLCAVFVPADGVSVQVKLDKYTKTPLSAEISSDGRVRVFAEISDWSLTGLMIEDNI